MSYCSDLLVFLQSIKWSDVIENVRNVAIIFASGAGAWAAIVGVSEWKRKKGADADEKLAWQVLQGVGQFENYAPATEITMMELSEAIKKVSEIRSIPTASPQAKMRIVCGALSPLKDLAQEIKTARYFEALKSSINAGQLHWGDDFSEVSSPLLDAAKDLFGCYQDGSKIVVKLGLEVRVREIAAEQGVSYPVSIKDLDTTALQENLKKAKEANERYGLARVEVIEFLRKKLHP